jgi:hypothetical protein
MVSASAIADGVEPQPCISRSHGEVLVRLRLIGSTRRQPARAGFKTLVKLGIAALRLRQRERQSRIGSSGSGTDQGGFDAVAAGKIEMDEPGFRARCAPRIRSADALSAEPISVFHGSHLVCKREHTVSLCHGTLAGRSGDASGVAPKDWINQRDDTAGTGCPSAVGPAPAQLSELVGLLVRCTEHDGRHSRRRRAAYPGDWKASSPARLAAAGASAHSAWPALTGHRIDSPADSAEGRCAGSPGGVLLSSRLAPSGLSSRHRGLCAELTSGPRVHHAWEAKWLKLLMRSSLRSASRLAVVEKRAPPLAPRNRCSSTRSSYCNRLGSPRGISSGWKAGRRPNSSQVDAGCRT